MQVVILNQGATIQSILVPDRHGHLDDVVLGFDNYADYLSLHPFFGSTIGRYAGRIAGAEFSIDGRAHRLSKSASGNHVHGGVRGFDKFEWESGSAATDPRRVELLHTSPDGSEGYPGELRIAIVFSLDDTNTLSIQYRACTDKPTVINLTNHSYFNLGGRRVPNVLGHEILLSADEYLPTNGQMIPTGELAKVEGTPFDFRDFQLIGKMIEAGASQSAVHEGYDHTWVLAPAVPALKLAARVLEPVSGRRMDVFTTEPGIHFYTGNSLDGSIAGKDNTTYASQSGFCLETQHFPNSPNEASFPPTELFPGDIHRSETRFSFSCI